MAKDFAIGIMLSGGELSWAAVRRARSTLEKVDSARIPLPEPSDAVTGEEAAAERRAVFKRAFAKLKGRMSVILPSAKVLVRTVRFPVVPDDELAGMVRLQVDKFSPFPAESTVVAHEVVSREEDGLLVLIAAVERRVVDALTEDLLAAGVRPHRVDVSGIVWARILKDTGKTALEGRQPMVFIAATGTEIVVFENGVPVLFRALAEIDAGREEGADEVAREIEYSLMTMELERGPALLQPVGIWCGEGQDAVLKKRIEEVLRAEVFSGPLDLLATPAEGAARRLFDAGALNLVPETWRVAGTARLFKKRMLTAAGVLFGLWLALVGAGAGAMMYRQAGLDELRREVESLVAPAMEVRDLRRRVVLVKRYMDKRDSALEYLREISAILPDGIDLSSFSYRKGEGVKISGTASVVGLVYDFKNAIDGSQLFREAALNGPHRTREGTEVFDIEILLREKGEGQ